MPQPPNLRAEILAGVRSIRQHCNDLADDDFDVDEDTEIVKVVAKVQDRVNQSQAFQRVRVESTTPTARTRR